MSLTFVYFIAIKRRYNISKAIAPFSSPSSNSDIYGLKHECRATLVKQLIFFLHKLPSFDTYCLTHSSLTVPAQASLTSNASVMGKLSSPLDYFEPHILRNLCDALLLSFLAIFRLNSHNNNNKNGHNMVDSNNNNKKGNNSAFHKYLQQFVAQ